MLEEFESLEDSQLLYEALYDSRSLTGSRLKLRSKLLRESLRRHKKGNSKVNVIPRIRTLHDSVCDEEDSNRSSNSDNSAEDSTTKEGRYSINIKSLQTDH